MESFLTVLEDTKEELGRPLREKELDFLHWMYERYQEEKNQNERINA